MVRSGHRRVRHSAVRRDIPALTALDLLRLQAEPSLDARGRIARCHGVAIASCGDGHALWIGDEVPDAVAGALAAAFDRASPGRPSEPPPVLAELAGLLGDGLQRAGGPSYVMPPDVRFAPTAPIECAGGAGADRLRGANPGNWHPVEWDELLDGRLGPW